MIFKIESKNYKLIFRRMLPKLRKSINLLLRIYLVGNKLFRNFLNSEKILSYSTKIRRKTLNKRYVPTCRNTQQCFSKKRKLNFNSMGS
jgi:hypothetical protein